MSLNKCPKCKRYGLAGAGGVSSCLYCGHYQDRRKKRPTRNPITPEREHSAEAGQRSTNGGEDVSKKIKLSAEEQAVIMEPNPVWECDPPQREEHTSDEAYTRGLILYARRVIKYRKSNPSPTQ